MKAHVCSEASDCLLLWVLQSYYFSTNNPYKDSANVFTEGQEKAREGDLNTAVLLLEAAILQDPQDAEVRHHNPMAG